MSASFDVIAGWTLVAEELLGLPNYVGFLSGEPGSITPTTLLGYTIFQLTCDPYAGPPATFFSISGSVNQDFFTTLVLNGTTFNATDAVFGQSGGGIATWYWESVFPITIAGTYTVTIV